ncbi:hypothetical protein BO71DRAFT_6514 [Aspergillus ellipticus CBS 707.79]|uniref:Nucleic acid-binding protein n=1 Tax=Aspergillus ellipticus CBS 707.79 TaxID=1448320 RepID=A0A319DFY7_9EURO|nr:hypothetical protein BO71DRAFT_6514 [Aspergillus ellipticus CBS 707.79]
MSAFTSALRPAMRASSGAALSARSFSSSSSRNAARLILTGRLAGEPELRTAANGQEIVRYTLATTNGGKETRHTSFFKVSGFLSEGAQRDYILNLRKGALVYFEGDASIRTIEDSEGKKTSQFGLIQRKSCNAYTYLPACLSACPPVRLPASPEMLKRQTLPASKHLPAAEGRGRRRRRKRRKADARSPQALSRFSDTPTTPTTPRARPPSRPSRPSPPTKPCITYRRGCAGIRKAR